MSILTPEHQEFRQAMAHLAVAVNTVTTDGPPGRLGITVSAVCSVTDTPPTVLVCVNQRSAAHDVFASNGMVAVNTRQRADGPGPALFRCDEGSHGGTVHVGHLGGRHRRAHPARCRVALVGRIRDSLSRGTHSVMFVEIESIRIRDEAEALVYYERGFHRISELTAV